MKKRILGFTLIELLIVITIIGILAVVFIPNVMNAPAKARDVQRITDVHNMVKAVESARLDNKLALDTSSAASTTTAPAKLGSMCITSAAPFTDTAIKSLFTNGVIPKDPLTTNTAIAGCSAGQYYVYVDKASTGFKYAVVARVEVPAKNGNVACPATAAAAASLLTTDPAASADATDCYFAKSM